MIYFKTAKCQIHKGVYMPDKSSDLHDEEVNRLRARIEELESEVQRKRPSSEERRNGRGRTLDSLNDATFRKTETFTRMARGLTVASLEGVRLFADAVSSFADGVATRNTSRDDSPRRLARRLPADMADGFADAIDRIVEIPARAAERYAEVHRQGKTDQREERHEKPRRDGKALDDYTVAELKEIAEREGVDIKSEDVKADIVAAIRKHRTRK
jgi:hypothetical protein